MVKKITAIFLLSIYLFSATQLYELLKINVLVDHFYETRLNNPDISFFDFLVMHYITDDGNNKDNDRDAQLPYKSHDSFVAYGFSTFILNRPEGIALPPLVIDKADFQNYDNLFISSNYSNLVWNPPRIS